MSVPIDKSLDDIRTDMYARIEQVQIEYAAAGWLPTVLNLAKGVIRGMLELWNWGLYQLYLFLQSVLTQAFASSATGLWLDLHCRQVEIYRLAKTKTAGTVHFMRAGSTGNVMIPAGRIVKTLPDGTGAVYRFVTISEVVLADGRTEVAAPVRAEEYGAGPNVVTGQINRIVTTISGVDSVENRPGWLTSEGTDQEADDALRERYVLAWQEKNGCTKYAYQAWARSVTGVASATILDQHPRGQGTVDVVITGTAGAPTTELIQAVDAVVQAKRPINDDVLVKGPTLVTMDIVAELELVSGNAEEIEAAALQRINALFSSGSTISGITALAVGQDVPLDLLRWVLMGIAGVKRVVFTSPADDTAVADDGLAVLQSVTITSSTAGEA